jgi:hypothetical protein
MPTFNEILDHAFNTKEKNSDWTGERNCSGFVRMVAAQLRIKLEGQQADDQLDYMARAWVPIKSGLHAAQLASQHFFVVAGLKSTDYDPPRAHGHVVVVVPVAPAGMPVDASDLYRDRYPSAWGGDIGGLYTSRGRRSVGEIFNKKVRDKVRYYTPRVAGPHTPRYVRPAP